MQEAFQPHSSPLHSKVNELIRIWTCLAGKPKRLEQVWRAPRVSQGSRKPVSPASTAARGYTVS